jgi:hypothetical protein
MPRFVLSIILFLSASAAAMQAMDLSPFAGPSATLFAADGKQRMALWRAITVDAYLAHGSKNPVWDADLVRVLEAAAASVSKTAMPMPTRDARALAKKLLTGQPACEDPLAKWALDVFERELNPGRDAAESALAVARLLAADDAAQPGGKPRYAALLRVQPLKYCVNYVGNVSDQESIDHLAVPIVNDLAAAMAAVIRGHECDAAPSSLIRMGNGLGIYRKEFGEPLIAAVDAALDEAKVDAGVADTLKAALRICNAWAWRGGGYAGTVTDEGWKRFAENLEEADRLLIAAHALRPKDPLIGTFGVTVAHAGKSKVSAEEWLQRAMSACFDFTQVLEDYRNFQLPRWGGSYEDMLALGCDCVDTGRFDTEVPWHLISSMVAVVTDAYDTKAEADMVRALADARVQRAFTATIEAFAKRWPANTAYYDGLRVGYLWQSGRKVEAQALLGKLKADDRDGRAAEAFRFTYDEVLRFVQPGRPTDF